MVAPAVIKTVGIKAKHIQKKNLGMNYTCELCRQVFNFKERLKQLVDIKHNVVKDDCENC